MLALLPLPASASLPIVGLWSMSVHTTTGEGIAVVWDEFDPNGRLTVRFVTKAGTETYTGAYRMVSGTVVWAKFMDYEPKMTCTLVCSPVKPVLTLGKSGTTVVRFIGTNIMYLGSDRFNRQR
jgi:hypothetical protein